MRAADALDADLDLLTRAVREAGLFAFSKFRAQFKSWTKAGNSPVSEVDLAANEILGDVLRDARPAYAWLSEESADDRSRLEAERVWIVDPIDGTRAFIAGKDDWCVVAALVERGRPVAAALFAPVEDLLLQARSGGGVVKNGAPLAMSGPSPEPLRIAGPPRWLEQITAARREFQAVPKVHSLALRIARVATGALDIAIAGRNCNDWDIAAADLIVAESGGLLTGLDERPIQYNRASTSHPALFASKRERHAALAALLRQHAP